MLLLKHNKWWAFCFVFLLKIISWACLLGSLLKLIFQCKAHLLIWYKSLFNLFAEVSTSWIAEKKMYHLQTISHLIIGHQLDCWYKLKKKTTQNWTLKDSCVYTCPWKSCSLKVFLCFLSFKKSDKRLSSLPEMPFCFSMTITSLCQTLSNAFEVSRKTPLTLNLSSKDLCISWVKEKTG